MGQYTGLYKFGYGRTVCVANVSANTVTVFVCSSSPRDPASCNNTHRWVSVDSAPIQQRQPPKTIAVLPPGSLTQDAVKPVYLCFTHALEATPVLQGQPPLDLHVPGNAHLSIPYLHGRATLDEVDLPNTTALAGNPYIRCLVKCVDLGGLIDIHQNYWDGGGFDDFEIAIPPSLSLPKEDSDDNGKDPDNGKNHGTRRRNDWSSSGGEDIPDGGAPADDGSGGGVQVVGGGSGGKAAASGNGGRVADSGNGRQVTGVLQSAMDGII